MKTRKEAVQYIGNQMKELDTVDNSKSAWHYGYHDLRKLMDFIYENDKPNEDELLHEAKDGRIDPPEDNGKNKPISQELMNTILYDNYEIGE